MSSTDPRRGRDDETNMPPLVVTTLPVPVQVTMPEGWTAVERQDDLPEGVAIAALHPHPDHGVTATITMDGDQWPPHQTLEDIAASSVERIATSVDEGVEIRSRTAVGSDEVPGLTQSLCLRQDVGGQSRRLIQDQVYIGLIDEFDSTKRIVLRLVLTASSEQHDQVVADYETAVSSILPITDRSS